MSDAGCGPTTIAMTISQLTGEEITPDTIAALGKKELPGYSTYNLFPEIAKKFGMNYEDTENEADIIRNLKEGTPVLLSGRGNGIDSLSPCCLPPKVPSHLFHLGFYTSIIQLVVSH